MNAWEPDRPEHQGWMALVALLDVFLFVFGCVLIQFMVPRRNRP